MPSLQEWFRGKDQRNEIASHIQPTKTINATEEQNLYEDLIFCGKIFPEIPQIPLSIDEFFPVVYSYSTSQFLFVRPAPVENCGDVTITERDVKFRLQSLHEEFTEMHDTIQTDRPSETVVPITFHPFLVKWEDDMWYRCIIYDFKGMLGTLVEFTCQLYQKEFLKKFVYFLPNFYDLVRFFLFSYVYVELNLT